VDIQDIGQSLPVILHRARRTSGGYSGQKRPAFYRVTHPGEFIAICR